ncbi:MAG: OmpA family protein [Paracoccaceae bacterium]
MKGNIMKPIRSTMLISSLALLAACTTSNDPVYTQFYREAGSVTDNGTFGNATLNNTLIQNGEQGYTVTLTERFSSEVMPMVNFAFNSAQLDGQAQAILREQANWIRQFPEVRFRVYGHTDLVGSNAYNRRLGLRRAKTVVNYLVGQGISRKRLEALSSFGETRPLIQTQNRERRNRRTVTEVSGFVQSNSLVLDGKYAQIVYRDYVASAQAESTLTGITGSDLRTEQ